MQGLARCLVDHHGWDGTDAADSAWRVMSSNPRNYQEEIQCSSELGAIFPAQAMRDCLVNRYGWLSKQADSVASSWAETAHRAR